jgi:hypothetical protein
MGYYCLADTPHTLSNQGGADAGQLLIEKIVIDAALAFSTILRIPGHTQITSLSQAFIKCPTFRRIRKPRIGFAIWSHIFFSVRVSLFTAKKLLYLCDKYSLFCRESKVHL